MDDPRRRQLKFRAWRRGFKEMDLILGPFADARLPEMSEADLLAFAELLEQPDQDIYAWLIGREATPADQDTPMLAAVRAHHLGDHSA